MNRRADQAGFTLVELMIALLLGLLILAGIFNVMVSSRASYQIQNGMGQIQESARFALETMAFDIRNSGFTGCTRRQDRIENTLDDPNGYYGNLLAGVESYNANDGGWVPALPDQIINPTVGSDVLTLRVTDDGDVFVRSAMTGLNAPIQITPGAVGDAVEVGSVVALTDCLNTSVFQVNGVDASTDTVQHVAGKNTQDIEPGNASAAFVKRYDAGAQLIVMDTVSYFIRDNSDTSTRINSLWRRRGSRPSEELLEGVENMQILLGQDPDGDQVVDAYVTPDLAVAAETVAVRIHLLLQSLDETSIDLDARTFDLGGEEIAAFNDRRLRRVFTKTVSLRNRLP